jgi:hypothetical protein
MAHSRVLASVRAAFRADVEDALMRVLARCKDETLAVLAPRAGAHEVFAWLCRLLG